MDFLVIVIQLALIVILAFGLVVGAVYGVFFGGISLAIHAIKYWYRLINRVIE